MKRLILTILGLALVGLAIVVVTVGGPRSGTRVGDGAHGAGLGLRRAGLVTVDAGRAASAPAGPRRLRRGPGVGGGRLCQRDAVERPRLAAEVAVLPCATIDGDRVAVHNIRNLDYRMGTSPPPTTTARSTCAAWTEPVQRKDEEGDHPGCPE
jgi:hypothetical protein